ncbi:MAG: hypothetical protein V4709_10550 [Pseudomonadota bacterium]
MKNQLRAGIALASIFLLCSQAALAGDQDFTLINKTGYEISEVYVAPSKSDEWEEDVLGQDVLVDGDRVDITFSRKTKSCFWDMKVVYTIDNTTAEWDRFNLCEVSKIKIYYNAETDSTSATYE